jgi:DUF4097 and DUF4098 domain-containing protein YvlB
MGRSVFIPSLAAAALLAAAPPAAQGQRDRDEYSSRIDTTVAFSRGGALELEIGSGEIIVSGWSRDQVRVRATSERGALRFDASPSLISLGLRSGRSGETRLEVTVPAGVRIRASAASGDVRITGTRGEVEARAQSGDIVVEDAGPRVEINAFSGDVEATRIVGDLRVNVLSGDVKIAGVGGDLEVKTVSGEIDIRDARTKSVRANTTSGDITYEGTIDPAGRYELQTHSGDVELTIPADVGAMLTVSTYNGGIESDFPLTLQPGDHGVSNSHGKAFTFRLGNGAARISAESFSGDINIRSRGGRPSRDGDDRGTR